MKPFMRSAIILLLLVSLAVAYQQKMARRRSIPLPTSKTLLTPVPGVLHTTNGFPVTVALSPDGRHLALLNAGYGTADSEYRQSIAIFDMQTNTISDFPDSRLGKDARQTYFLGLAFSTDGQRLYAPMASITDPLGKRSGDTGNGIAVYRFENGKIQPERFIPIPLQPLAPGKRLAKDFWKVTHGGAIPYPAGIAVVSANNKDELLVANNLSDNAVLLDVASGEIMRTFDLTRGRNIPASFPYGVVATKDGRHGFCSLWNASEVAQLDLTSGQVVRSIPLLKPDSPIASGSHPTAMLLSPDEKLLYVALSNSDTVAVVNVAIGKIAHLLSTKLPGQQYGGSFPEALAQSSDGKRLFVANSSADAVAVFDVSSFSASAQPATALGFIPTDWYPTALAVRGDDLLVASAKGEGTGPNGNTRRDDSDAGYIGTLLHGSIARHRISTMLPELAGLTREVEQNNLMDGETGKIIFQSGSNPIRHVIYIIKENRTYDQVFGDLKQGNGDPSLTMYGEDITPNQHKLARQFGILDNFYDSGEVSGDGHVWSTAAITSDYNEKTWQIAYRSRERSYDFEGEVAGEYPLYQNQSDVNEPQTGYIWANIASHGLTYRHYGEFVSTIWCGEGGSKPRSPRQGTPTSAGGNCDRIKIQKGEPLPPNVGQPHGSPSPYSWPIPVLSHNLPSKPELRGHFDPNFADFRTDYPDQLRVDEFLNEFEKFIAARKQGSSQQLPAFTMLRIPNDHTSGKRRLNPTPVASVADNDLAVGRVVEAISHSPYWEDTALFILEDDAQDGADHIDAHRSIALVISKYAPDKAQSPFVDHHFYTTVNMVRTMESLLGLPPMNNNDARAAVMAPLFAGSGSQPAFVADYRNRNNSLIYQMNPANGPGEEESARMDFSHADAAPASRLNAILWRDRMGNSPMPPPRHSLFAPDLK